MHESVCAWVCVCMGVFVYGSVCTWGCVHRSVCACMFVVVEVAVSQNHVGVTVNKSKGACACVCACACVRVCMCVCMWRQWVGPLTALHNSPVFCSVQNSGSWREWTAAPCLHLALCWVDLGHLIILQDIVLVHCTDGIRPRTW